LNAARAPLSVRPARRRLPKRDAMRSLLGNPLPGRKLLGITVRGLDGRDCGRNVWAGKGGNWGACMRAAVKV
jgi:hypothetical protein